MRRHVLVIGLWFLGLSAFALVSGWAFFGGAKLGGGLRDLSPILPYVAGAVAIVAALTGFFMWLAFYSANHGYDDRIDQDGP